MAKAIAIRLPNTVVGGPVAGFTTASGFPELGLSELYLLDDSDATSVILDSRYPAAISSAPVNPGSGANVEALSGGGLRLTKNATIPSSHTVDIREPWAIAWAGNVRIPTNAGARLTGLAGFQEASAEARGAIGFASAASQPDTDDVVAVSLSAYADGATSGQSGGAKTAASFTYLDQACFCLQHAGNGLHKMSVIDSTGVILSSEKTYDIDDLAAGLGSPFNYLLTPSVGISNVQVSVHGAIDVELVAFYSGKGLSSNDLAQFFAGAQVYATARSRALE